MLVIPVVPAFAAAPSPSIPIRLPPGNPFPTQPTSAGCFESEPYTGVWTEIQCSYGNIRPTVGGGSNDYMLSDSTSTSAGNGSIYFPTYAGETNTLGSNLCYDGYGGSSTTYSLQQNTDQFDGSNGDKDVVQFTSQVVHGLKPAVGVWEIDVTTQNYDHNSTASPTWNAPLNTTIEYYLNGGLVYSHGYTFVETELYYVNYPKSGSDTISKAVVVSILDSYSLKGHWTYGEMNVFGIGCGNQATFTSGSSGSPYISFPVCNGNRFSGTETAESNNFNLGSSTTVSCSTSNTAYLYFSESH